MDARQPGRAPRDRLPRSRLRAARERDDRRDRRTHRASSSRTAPPTPRRRRKGNDVYFAVRAFPGYGKLSHRNVDDLLAGARVEVGEVKRDPLDFALWKASSADEWGWESPWGKGRPGLAHRVLGDGARSYLVAALRHPLRRDGPHLPAPRERDRAERGRVGRALRAHWLHTGFLNVDTEKMSKSLGNFVTIAQVLERNDPEALRYFLLGTHYRGPLSFDLEKLATDGRVVFPGIDEAERRVEYLYDTQGGPRGRRGGGRAVDRGGLAERRAPSRRPRARPRGARQRPEHLGRAERHRRGRARRERARAAAPQAEEGPEEPRLARRRSRRRL